MGSSLQSGIVLCLMVVFATVDLGVRYAFAQGVPKPVLVTRLKLADLPGRWVGIGRVEFRDGDTDRMKCRITYRIRDNSKIIQNIRCKSEKRRIEIKTQFVDNGGKITGAWRDRVYEVSGRIKGQLHGNQLKAALSGLFFNADLNIMLIGSEQTIEVKPRDSSLRLMRILLARG